MKLFYGAFNKDELNRLKKFIYVFDIIYLDNNISKQAGELEFSYM